MAELRTVVARDSTTKMIPWRASKEQQPLNFWHFPGETGVCATIRLKFGYLAFKEYSYPWCVHEIQDFPYTWRFGLYNIFAIGHGKEGFHWPFGVINVESVGWCWISRSELKPLPTMTSLIVRIELVDLESRRRVKEDTIMRFIQSISKSWNGWFKRLGQMPRLKYLTRSFGSWPGVVGRWRRQNQWNHDASPLPRGTPLSLQSAMVTWFLESQYT